MLAKSVQNQNFKVNKFQLQPQASRIKRFLGGGCGYVGSRLPAGEHHDSGVCRFMTAADHDEFDTALNEFAGGNMYSTKMTVDSMTDLAVAIRKRADDAVHAKNQELYRLIIRHTVTLLQLSQRYVADNYYLI